MSKYSKPELEQQANELNHQILVVLSAIGIKAELNACTDGIKIPEYTYDIASVREPNGGSGFSRQPTGKLEVDFRSVHTGRGCLCHAKRFKADTKDLVQKVVTSIKERREAIVAQAKREREMGKARSAHQKILKSLSLDFPDFNGNIEHHSSQINLNFHGLDEDKARRILLALRNAGIKGDRGFGEDD
jgi:hypothetical protein